MKPPLTFIYGPPFDYAKQSLRESYGAATAAEAKARGIPWQRQVVLPSNCPGVIEALQMVEKLVGQMEKCLVAGVELPKLYPFQKHIFDSMQYGLDYSAAHEPKTTSIKGYEATALFLDECVEMYPLFDFGWIIRGQPMLFRHQACLYG